MVASGDGALDAGPLVRVVDDRMAALEHIVGERMASLERTMGEQVLALASATSASVERNVERMARLGRLGRRPRRAHRGEPAVLRGSDDGPHR